MSLNQKKYLNIVQNKTNDLIKLTKQLFEFSKVIDLDITLEKENCCINEILEETLVSFYNIFKEKNIIPSISICSKKIYKNINKISLIRIFENILSNVSKYSNGDFKVELSESGIIIFSNTAKLFRFNKCPKNFCSIFFSRKRKRF